MPVRHWFALIVAIPLLSGTVQAALIGDSISLNVNPNVIVEPD